jgi:hypothetical protein
MLRFAFGKPGNPPTRDTSTFLPALRLYPYQRHSFDPQCNDVLALRLTLIRFIGLLCG